MTTRFSPNVSNYPYSIAKHLLQADLLVGTVDEMANVAAADAVAILTAQASQVTAVTYGVADLDGTIGDGAISPPRNITITTAGLTPADAPAEAVVTGYDVNGSVITETITVAQTATVAAGVKCFASITSIAFTAGDGTGATMSVGTGDVIGLGSPIASRAGYAHYLGEKVNGVMPATDGTFSLPTVNAPNGGYTPNTAPNGTNDYVITYEVATAA